MTDRYSSEELRRFEKIRDDILTKALRVSEQLKGPYSHPALQKRAIWKFYAEDMGTYDRDVPVEIRRQFGIEDRILKLIPLA